MYRRMSRSGSNQPEAIPIDSVHTSQQKDAPKKAKGKTKKVATQKNASISMVPFDSPAMSTRSKRVDPASPAMGTRSKRRLSL